MRTSAPDNSQIIIAVTRVSSRCPRAAVAVAVARATHATVEHCSQRMNSAELEL